MILKRLAHVLPLQLQPGIPKHGVEDAMVPLGLATKKTENPSVLSLSRRPVPYIPADSEVGHWRFAKRLAVAVER
jgi:hypothetical protein